MGKTWDEPRVKDFFRSPHPALQPPWKSGQKKHDICFVMSCRAVPPGSAAFYDPILWGPRHEMTSPKTQGLVYSYSEELQHPELFNLIPSPSNEGYFKTGKGINQSEHKNMPNA